MMFPRSKPSRLLLATAVVVGSASLASAANYRVTEDRQLAPQNVQANHCELYVDAVSPVGNWVTPHERDWFSTHSLKLWLKTPLTQENGQPKLDGKIRRVAFRYQLNDYNHEIAGKKFCDDRSDGNQALVDCFRLEASNDGLWMALDLKPAGPGVKDYWEATLPLDAADTFSKQWTGAFYVETAKTRYWLNKDARSGENFVIDIGTYTDVESRIGNGRFGSLDRTSRANAMTTYGGSFSYLNPSNCHVN